MGVGTFPKAPTPFFGFREAMYTRVSVAPVDLMSVVIGSPVYETPSRLNGLGEFLHGAHSVKAYTVTRGYLLVTPRVCVDFEPEPGSVPHRSFVPDAKRAWCTRQGWVYVPIFWKERLTKEAFSVRLGQERDALDLGVKTLREDKVFDVELTIQEEEARQIVQRHALRQLEREIAGGRDLRGPVRTRRLATIVTEVERDLRKHLRQRGSLDSFGRAE